MGTYVGSFSDQGTRAVAATATPRIDLGKVPEVTLGFWILKIAATTLGETGGDAVTMSLGLGYAIGTLIFAGLFAALLAAELATPRFRPFLYWGVVVATPTVVTTMADFADRSLHIGYPGGTLLLASCLAVSQAVWRWSEGEIAATAIRTREVEPVSHGGLALNRFEASALLGGFIVLALLLIPQRAGDHPGAKG